VRLTRALNRLDEAVIPKRWLYPHSDPVRRAAQIVYRGAAFLVIGGVLAVAFQIYVGLAIGAMDTIYGAVRLSAALKECEAASN
jgi:hypothetical protein